MCIFLSEVTGVWPKQKQPWACLMCIPKVSSGQGSVCFQKQFSCHAKSSECLPWRHNYSNEHSQTSLHPASEPGVELAVCAAPPTAKTSAVLKTLAEGSQRRRIPHRLRILVSEMEAFYRKSQGSS